MKKIVGVYGLTVFGLFLFLLPSIGEGAKDKDTVTCKCSKQSLQTVINQTAADATILVNGTCYENVVIDETKINITLDGAGTATIHGTDITSDVVEVRGRGIVIQRLNITGGRNGIRVNRGGTAIIGGNTIESTNNNGVQIVASSYATVINNMIQNNAQHGIEIHDNATAHIGFAQYSDTVAQPNTIQNNGKKGINVQRSSTASVVGNTIQNNTNQGIHVHRDSHADISDNTINGNGAEGIFVSENSGVNPGNSTGSTIFDLPNSTTVNNATYGIWCTAGGYVGNGRLGTLNGAAAATAFSFGCLNFLQ